MFVIPAIPNAFGRSGILLGSHRKDSGRAGMSAPESVRGRRGGSPLQVYALRPVTERKIYGVRLAFVHLA